MAHLHGGGAIQPVANFPVAVSKLFFSDETSEMRETLMHYVNAALAVTLVPVPGDTRLYPKRSPRARRATAAFVAWFCDLHGLGYSLLGVFGENDFGIDHRGNFRGRMPLLHFVQQITKTVNAVESDMMVVADIIHNNIHAGLPIPEDLEHLLNRLRIYSIRFSPLVRSHASHEEEDVKSALFIKMHNRLKVIEKMNPAAYANILNIVQLIPDSSVWLRNAMMNTHLHAFLRYAPWNSNNPRTLVSVVTAFLTKKVHYTEDAIGLLNCRRNGLAHLEADYSVDTIGSFEAALYGAAEGLKTFHQRQHNLQMQLQQPVIPLETRLRMRLPLWMASHIARALSVFLFGAQLSLEAAKAGAAATANYVAVHGSASNQTTQAAVAAQTTQAAVAAGRLAAATQIQQGVVAQAPQPSRMFNADDIDHMYHVSAPRLLVGLQRIMFGQGECFRLGDDTKVPQLTV